MGSFERQQRTMDKIERPFIRDIVIEKNRFIEEQAHKVYNTRRISDDDYAKHKSNMMNIFAKYYSKTIEQFYSLIEGTTKKSLYNLETKQRDWVLFLVEWINERGGVAAQQTSTTTRDDIQKALLSAISSEEALTERSLVQKVLAVKGFSQFRARAIARTETHGAAMWASRRTANKIQIDTGIEMVKVWNAVEDERTRISHAGVDGQRRLMSQDFNVGGVKMDRPGDPKGGAGNVINCRCVLTYEPRE